MAAEIVPTARLESRPSGEPALAAPFHAAGCSDRGRTRRTNEDRFRVDDDLRLLLVADGMGGHDGGEVASSLAADVIVDSLRETAYGADVWPFGLDATLSEDGNRLRTAVHAAHMRVLETSFLDRSLAGMGTTVVAAVERGGHLAVAWVGDSRLYVLGAGCLRRVTRDDSWLESALQDNPHADREALERHPLRNALTNVVGNASRTEVHVVEVPLREGDVVLLTTDGVHATVDDAQITRLVSRRADPARAAADLVAAAMVGGSTDNCTAVVARF